MVVAVGCSWPLVVVGLLLLLVIYSPLPNDFMSSASGSFPSLLTSNDDSYWRAVMSLILSCFVESLAVVGSISPLFG